MRTQGSPSSWSGGALNNSLRNISRHTIKSAMFLDSHTPLLAWTGWPSPRRYEFGQSKVASHPPRSCLHSMVSPIDAFTKSPWGRFVLWLFNTFRQCMLGNFTLSRNSVKAVFVVGVIAAWMSATPCCCCGCATGRGCCDSCDCTGEWVAAWMPATPWCGQSLWATAICEFPWESDLPIGTQFEPRSL